MYYSFHCEMGLWKACLFFIISEKVHFMYLVNINLDKFSGIWLFYSMTI